MNILFLNTTPNTGGAAIAASRIAKAVEKKGIHTDHLYRPENRISFLRFLWERLIIFTSNGFNREKLFQVSIANTGSDISKLDVVQNADIIHIHWINQGFLSLTDIKKLIALRKPIVWTMHDMWPMTGICHHSWGCKRYQTQCGHCPFLHSNKESDLSTITWKKKQFMKDSKIQLVAVSSWLASLSKESFLTKDLDVKVIPNVIDTTIFTPKNRNEMRDLHSLPNDKKIIVVGAARLNDPIKGFEYLMKAITILSKKRSDIFLILFGGIKHDASFLSKIPIPYKYFGSLNDPSIISQIYSAADVTVVSSHYETFGQTIIEGMACGSPAVSFDNSGQTDIIDHQINGYLAKYKDADDLAAGIEWVIENRKTMHLSEACVKKVKENYTEEIVADKYIELYKSLLQNY